MPESMLSMFQIRLSQCFLLNVLHVSHNVLCSKKLLHASHNSKECNCVFLLNCVLIWRSHPFKSYFFISFFDCCHRKCLSLVDILINKSKGLNRHRLMHHKASFVTCFVITAILFVHQSTEQNVSCLQGFLQQLIIN